MAHFIGVGVSRYATGSVPLEHAVCDVQRVADALAPHFHPTVIADPDETTVRAKLDNVPDSLPEGGHMVFMWSGHAKVLHNQGHADALRLLASDTKSLRQSAGILADDVTSSAAESGAAQLMLIFDTCFSGTTLPAFDIAAHLVPQTANSDGECWVGILASCQPAETARDGLFASHLIRLLTEGPPPGPDAQTLIVQRWSRHTQFITGDDLGDAVLKTWDSDVQQPYFRRDGSAMPMIPNPLYRPEAPERVVEHLLLAARSGREDRSWFTGRAAEVNRVVSWARERSPGIRVITGSAGVGKSAILGRVVSLSDPAERVRLLSQDPLPHDDPGEHSVDAHLHARGLAANQAAADLGPQLVRSGHLNQQEDARNAYELVGQLERAGQRGARVPVVVVDGLDEARSKAEVADGILSLPDFLVLLKRHATIIVSAREVSKHDSQRSSLVEVLAGGQADLDLDADETRERSRTDIRAYIERRLANVAPAMDPELVAAQLTTPASITGEGPFLLARLVTDQLRAAPVDTSQPGWESMISHSIGEALDTDLADARDPVRARVLLTALTWGFGAGFPEEEWLACARALAPDHEFTSADVAIVLDDMGRYILQDGLGGVAVYRLAHQVLAEHVRPRYAPTLSQPFDPQALPVVNALADRYHTILDAGMPADKPTYLRRYIARHAAVAGPAGLQRLESLVEPVLGLLLDYADAELEIAAVLRRGDLLQEAVALAEDAARIRRLFAQHDPAFLPALAVALTNVGICFQELEQPGDALAPGEEAVQVCSRIQDEDPEKLPSLAVALVNLSSCYLQLDRPDDAMPIAEKAAQIYGSLATANHENLADFALALLNVSACHAKLGNLEKALEFAVQGVQGYTLIAEDQPWHLPDMAQALIILAGHARDLSRPQAAFEHLHLAARIFLQVRTVALIGPRRLARLLEGLERASRHAGIPGGADPLWEEGIVGADPMSAVFLISRRIEAADPANPSVIDWLLQARDLAVEADVPKFVEEVAREYRDRDPARFDETWAQVTGKPVPGWLTGPADTGRDAT